MKDKQIKSPFILFFLAGVIIGFNIGLRNSIFLTFGMLIGFYLGRIYELEKRKNKK